MIDKMIPDILSSMSTRVDIDGEMFQQYALHFLGYIDKEKQSGDLAKRMVLRFKNPTEDICDKELIFGNLYI